MTDGKVASEIDWNKLTDELGARVRRGDSDLDVESIVGDVLVELLEKMEREPVPNPAGLAHHILVQRLLDARRQAGRRRQALGNATGIDAHDGTVWSAVESAIVPADPGGRPQAQRYQTEEQLRAAVAEAIGAEFHETWKADAANVLPGALSEMNDQAPRDRRGWLAWAVDHALGDYAPWAVDPNCRVRGAFRRADATGVPDAKGIPDGAAWKKWKAERKPGRHALELLANEERMTQLLAGSATRAEFEAAFWAAAGALQDEPPPLGDEFLTDRELAILSLLLGNWPAAASKRVSEGVTVGSVVTAEIEAVQYARSRHGQLTTPDEKRSAGVGPAARRRPPPEKT